MMAKYLATSLAILKVVSAPRVIKSCLPTSTRFATASAAEKIYRSLGPDTSIDVKLEVGAGGTLAWLPQETILFDQVRLARSIDVELAHGASLLLSRKHRPKVAGIELADSITWDAHKMLFVPALCAFLFYKNKRHSYEAFRQDAKHGWPGHGYPDADGERKAQEEPGRSGPSWSNHVS